jgi:hypothetical protein
MTVLGPEMQEALEAAVQALRSKLPPGSQFGPSLNVLDAIDFSETVLAAALPHIRAALARDPEVVERLARFTALREMDDADDADFFIEEFRVKARPALLAALVPEADPDGED